ncbi:MAG: hypothetical protein WCS03_07695 [Bacteroidota bacterium]
MRQDEKQKDPASETSEGVIWRCKVPPHGITTGNPFLSATPKQNRFMDYMEAHGGTKKTGQIHLIALSLLLCIELPAVY